MCERVIVDRKVVASQPGLLARAPATGPLVHADPGPHPRAHRPPKIENEVDAVAVLASEGIARQMGQTVTKSDIHPETVSGRAILSVRRAVVCEQERAHETGDLGRHHGGCCLCMLRPNGLRLSCGRLARGRKDVGRSPPDASSILRGDRSAYRWRSTR